MNVPMNVGYDLMMLAQPGDRWDHMWWGPGGGWMWLWGPLMMLFWIAVVGVAVWLIVRAIAATQRPHEPDRGDERDRAKEILAERYARGEINTEEYRERLDQLR